jgi:hypothetical protein
MSDFFTDLGLVTGYCGRCGEGDSDWCEECEECRYCNDNNGCGCDETVTVVATYTVQVVKRRGEISSYDVEQAVRSRMDCAYPDWEEVYF